MSKQLESILGRATRATPTSESVPAPDRSGDARDLQAEVERSVAKSKPQPKPQTNTKRTAKAPAAAPSVYAAGPKAEPGATTGEGRGPVAKTQTGEPQRPIQAIVPVSVARALAVRAAMEDTTVRDLILRGLAAIGIDVPQDECRDRRR